MECVDREMFWHNGTVLTIPTPWAILRTVVWSVLTGKCSDTMGLSSQYLPPGPSLGLLYGVCWQGNVLTQWDCPHNTYPLGHPEDCCMECVDREMFWHNGTVLTIPTPWAILRTVVWSVLTGKCSDTMGLSSQYLPPGPSWGLLYGVCW